MLTLKHCLLLVHTYVSADFLWREILSVVQTLSLQPSTGNSWPVPVGAVAHVPFIKINGLKLEIISEIRFYVDLINPFRPVLSYCLRPIFAK